MGCWFVVGSVCFLFCDEWNEREVGVPIHAREAYISTGALMAAHALCPHRTLCIEYTDNTPTEFVHDSQHSKCDLLQLIVDARAEFMDASGVCSIPQRVSSKNNLWADQLSRGQWQLVVEACLALDLRPIWIDMPRCASVLRQALAAKAQERD